MRASPPIGASLAYRLGSDNSKSTLPESHSPTTRRIKPFTSLSLVGLRQWQRKLCLSAHHQFSPRCTLRSEQSNLMIWRKLSDPQSPWYPMSRHADDIHSSLFHANVRQCPTGLLGHGGLAFDGHDCPPLAPTSARLAVFELRFLRPGALVAIGTTNPLGGASSLTVNVWQSFSFFNIVRRLDLSIRRRSYVAACVATRSPRLQQLRIITRIHGESQRKWQWPL